MFKSFLSKNRNYYFCVLVIIAVTLLFRFISLNPMGTWFDEQCSIRGALGLKSYIRDPKSNYLNIIQPSEFETQSFQTSFFKSQNKFSNVLPATLLIDRGNGPLHYLTSHFWINLFGVSDVSVRLSSVLFGLLTLLIVLAFTEKYYDRTAALGTGLLLATNSGFNRISSDFRPYPFATLFLAASTYALFEIYSRSKINEDRKLWYFAYFVFASGAFFSHYLTAYIIFAHVVFCLLFLRSRRAWVGLVGSAVGLTALFAVWYYSGANQGLEIMGTHSKLWAERQIAAGGFSYRQLLNAIIEVFPKLLGITTLSGTVFQKNALVKVGFELTKGIGVLGVAVTVFYFIKGKLYRELKAPQTVLVLLILASCILYATYSSIQSQHYLPFIPRYIAFANIFSPILFVTVLLAVYRTFNRPFVKMIVIAAFAAQALAGVFQIVSHSVATRSYDWTSKNLFVTVAKLISTANPAEKIIVYPSWNIATMTNVYLPDDYSVDQYLKVQDQQFKEILVLDKKTGAVDFRFTGIEE